MSRGKRAGANILLSTKRYRVKDRRCNMEIDNNIKLHISCVWQNADELVRQPVYALSLTHLIIGLVLTLLAAVVVFVNRSGVGCSAPSSFARQLTIGLATCLHARVNAGDVTSLHHVTCSAGNM